VGGESAQVTAMAGSIGVQKKGTIIGGEGQGKGGKEVITKETECIGGNGEANKCLIGWGLRLRGRHTSVTKRSLLSTDNRSINRTKIRLLIIRSFNQ